MTDRCDYCGLDLGDEPVDACLGCGTPLQDPYDDDIEADQ